MPACRVRWQEEMRVLMIVKDVGRVGRQQSKGESATETSEDKMKLEKSRQASWTARTTGHV